VPDCKRLLSQMSAYMDGELPSDFCGKLEAHLSDCPNCRVMLDSLTQTVRICREGVSEPLPDELKQSLRAALEQRWAKKRKK
jgi:anti-sigma factor RsiW